MRDRGYTRRVSVHVDGNGITHLSYFKSEGGVKRMRGESAVKFLEEFKNMGAKPCHNGYFLR